MPTTLDHLFIKDQLIIQSVLAFSSFYVCLILGNYQNQNCLYFWTLSLKPDFIVLQHWTENCFDASWNCCQPDYLELINLPKSDYFQELRHSDLLEAMILLNTGSHRKFSLDDQWRGNWLGRMWSCLNSGLQLNW